MKDINIPTKVLRTEMPKIEESKRTGFSGDFLYLTFESGESHFYLCVGGVNSSNQQNQRP